MMQALIIGATSGLGRGMAKEMASRGYDLALVSKSTDGLSAIKTELEHNFPIGVKYFAIDLLNDGADLAVMEWLDHEKIRFNVLINNASLAYWGKSENLGLDTQLNMIRVNQHSFFCLTYRMLPLLRNMENAHILNVAGIGAFQPVPFFAIYAATKAFMLSFSRALRYELKDSGINVSCLCHGPADTDFFVKAGYSQSGIANNRTFKMSINDISKDAIDGLFARKSVIVPGLSNKMGKILIKLLPTRWMIRMAGYLFKQ